MKIKTGFISNSSSTCFILDRRDEGVNDKEYYITRILNVKSREEAEEIYEEIAEEFCTFNIE